MTMKSLSTLMIVTTVVLLPSIARGQDSTSVKSTIVQLSERSGNLTRVSREKYSQPLEEIRETLNKRVTEAVSLRQQLAADPTNRVLQAQFEHTLSTTFSELDRHMAALHEGRDEMLGAVDANLEVIKRLRQEMQRDVRTKEQQHERIDQESTELDEQLQQAAEQLGPLLASGEELPADVEALIQMVNNDLQVSHQQARITVSETRQLRASEENLRRFEKLLSSRRAQLEVAYHAVDGQRAVIRSLVSYRKQRVQNERLLHELNEFAQVTRHLNDEVNQTDLSKLGAITIDESGDATIIDFDEEPQPSRAAAELLRRYQESKSTKQVVNQE